MTFGKKCTFHAKIFWDVCFDLTAAPAGDFSLAFDGGLTLTYADADRTCCLAFTDDAMSGGRTSRYVKLDAPCRRLRVVGDAPAWGCKTLPSQKIVRRIKSFFENQTFFGKNYKIFAIISSISDIWQKMHVPCKNILGRLL